MKYEIIIAGLLIAFSCTKDRGGFVPIITGQGGRIPVEIQKDLYDKTGKNPSQATVEKWSEKEKRTKKIKLRGVVVLDLAEEVATETVRGMSKEISDRGYYPHLTNLHFDKEMKALNDLVIVKGYDKYDLLKLYDVSGVNYDVSNEDVISQIKKWERYMEIKIEAFDNDRFEGRITRNNYSIEKLAEENYRLCPDVIDQGYESRDELEKALRSEKFIWCWWD
jgi:hypothetical protein